MASPIHLDVGSETYVRDTTSDGSPSRTSYDNEAGANYISEPTRRTFIGRVLHAVGMHSRRRKAGTNYYSNPQDEALEGLLTRKSSKDSRKHGHSKVFGLLGRALLVLPVIALMVFGIFHILQVLFGRAIMLWDEDIYDDFLPTWGMPGHSGAGLVDYPTDATRDVIPIACHSHNDYWRRVPLFDALHWGCTSVEADVWLFDEELYVGHDTASLTRNRTFQNLYVNPLVTLLDSMNPSTEFANATHRGVFDVKPEQNLVLLVDIKTSGYNTFPYVQKQLAPLREKGYLSYWDGERIVPRPITVVGTGETPFDLVTADTSYRDIFFDAPLARFWEAPPPSSTSRSDSKLPREDLRARVDDDDEEAEDPEFTASIVAAIAAQQQDQQQQHTSSQGNSGTDLASPDSFDPSNSYYASVSFTSTVGFVWFGRLSTKQLEIIRGQIRGAQRRGLKVRYWDTPAWPVSLRNHIWLTLMRERTDMLNVDDLKGAATLNWKLRIHGLW